MIAPREAVQKNYKDRLVAREQLGLYFAAAEQDDAGHWWLKPAESITQ